MRKNDLGFVVMVNGVKDHDQVKPTSLFKHLGHGTQCKANLDRDVVFSRIKGMFKNNVTYN